MWPYLFQHIGCLSWEGAPLCEPAVLKWLQGGEEEKVTHLSKWLCCVGLLVFFVESGPNSSLPIIANEWCCCSFLSFTDGKRQDKMRWMPIAWGRYSSLRFIQSWLKEKQCEKIDGLSHLITTRLCTLYLLPNLPFGILFSGVTLSGKPLYPVRPAQGWHTTSPHPVWPPLFWHWLSQLRRSPTVRASWVICISWILYSGNFKGGRRGTGPPVLTQLYVNLFYERLYDTILCMSVLLGNSTGYQGPLCSKT